MGLFDDLIKKSSTSPQGGGMQGGNPPVQDPLQAVQAQTPAPIMQSQPIVIQKMSEESIITEKPIAQRPELPVAPTPVQATADDGESLLIVDENNTNSVIAPPTPADPIVMPVSTYAPPTQVIQAIEPVQIQPDGNNLFGTTNKDSLLDMQASRFNNPETIAITSEQEHMLGNLFGEEPSVQEVKQEETVAPEMTAEEIERDAEKEAERFETPLTFIEESLKKISGLIDHIEATHRAKLTEAALYKAEKERNAILEEGCYQDAEKMMQEKAHAEKMKKYFLSQKDIAEGTGETSSVETTLTSLSVKKSVDDTTTKKTKKSIKAEEVKTEVAV